MRTITLLLSIAFLLLGACRSGRRSTTRPAASEWIEATAPASAGPTRLRYYDVKDFPIQKGVLIVRASPTQLKEIDGHLSAMRRLLNDAKTQEAALPAKSAWVPVKNVVVQIHAVSDIVEALGAAKDAALSPQERLLATLHKELGADAVDESIVRFQGQHALVVKASPAAQERIAEILDALRAEM
jgi:hypothetical protein